MKYVLMAGTLMTSVVMSGAAVAQKTTAEGIAEYRAMIADGNPAELFEAKGEALWKTKRGPKAASLEACDLGLGAACRGTSVAFAPRPP